MASEWESVLTIKPTDCSQSVTSKLWGFVASQIPNLDSKIMRNLLRNPSQVVSLTYLGLALSRQETCLTLVSSFAGDYHFLKPSNQSGLTWYLSKPKNSFWGSRRDKKRVWLSSVATQVKLFASTISKDLKLFAPTISRVLARTTPQPHPEKWPPNSPHSEKQATWARATAHLPFLWQFTDVVQTLLGFKNKTNWNVSAPAEFHHLSFNEVGLHLLGTFTDHALLSANHFDQC